MNIIILLFYATLLLQTPSSYDNIVKTKKLWFFHLEALHAMLLLLLPSSGISNAKQKDKNRRFFLLSLLPISLFYYFLALLFLSHLSHLSCLTVFFSSALNPSPTAFETNFAGFAVRNKQPSLSLSPSPPPSIFSLQHRQVSAKDIKEPAEDTAKAFYKLGLYTSNTPNEVNQPPHSHTKPNLILVSSKSLSLSLSLSLSMDFHLKEWRNQHESEEQQHSTKMPKLLPESHHQQPSATALPLFVPEPNSSSKVSTLSDSTLAAETETMTTTTTNRLFPSKIFYFPSFFLSFFSFQQKERKFDQLQALVAVLTFSSFLLLPLPHNLITYYLSSLALTFFSLFLFFPFVGWCLLFNTPVLFRDGELLQLVSVAGA